MEGPHTPSAGLLVVAGDASGDRLPVDRGFPDLQGVFDLLGVLEAEGVWLMDLDFEIVGVTDLDLAAAAAVGSVATAATRVATSARVMSLEGEGIMARGDLVCELRFHMSEI